MPGPARPVGGVRDRHNTLSYPQNPHYLTVFVTSPRVVWFLPLTRLQVVRRVLQCMASTSTIWPGNRPRSAEIPCEAQLKKGIPEERIGTFTIYEPVGCEHRNDSDKG